MFQAALRNAGYIEAKIRTVICTWEMPSVDWFVSRVPSLSPGTDFLFGQMSPAVASAFTETLRRCIHERFGDGPVQFRAEAHLGTGLKG